MFDFSKKLSGKLHALLHGVGGRDESADIEHLHSSLVNEFQSKGVLTKSERSAYCRSLAKDALVDFTKAGCSEREVLRFVERFLDFEQIFVLPELATASTAEVWETRERLNRQQKLVQNFDDVTEVLTSYLSELGVVLAAHLPELNLDNGMIVSTDLMSAVSDSAALIETLSKISYSEDLSNLHLSDRTRFTLDRNIVEASGGDPSNISGFTKTPKPPSQSGIADGIKLAEAYLKNTPLYDLLNRIHEIVIPTNTRFEHHHIIAGSGHGKTQTLQYLIAHDLEMMTQETRSLVIIDSQGDLIQNISNMAVFAEGGVLEGKLVVIDPTDIEWPVSLNLFDVGQDRLASYPLLEKERLTNSILELYDFVLGSLLSAEMTQKQSVIFRYVTRLMLNIPNATIHTLVELMEPDSHIKFADSIEKLEGSARRFFETEFMSREFEQTKKQVLRRLWGILENQTFERMMSHPKSKLDLFAELNEGKVILINTAKDLLKETGTEILGRFFIALIAQAAQERATLPKSKRVPTFVYIDEAADYFDRNIGVILSQARKYNVGMILAHQYLSQLDPKLQDAFAANTSIKFAGGVSSKDARALAGQLNCDPALLDTRPKGGFAAQIRGVTKSAIPVSFPFGVMEGLPKMSKAERQKLQQRMRDKYAVHYLDLLKPEEAHVSQETSGTVNSEVDDDPTQPTKGW